MNKVDHGRDPRRECQRLQEIVQREGGTDSLSPTETAFLKSVCEPGHADLSGTADIVFASVPIIDNSGGNPSGTIIDDPDAGRPDDPDDANPAAPDPAITKE